MSKSWEGLLPDMNREFLAIALENRQPTDKEVERLRALKSKAYENGQTILRGLAAVGASLAESHAELTEGEFSSLGYLVQYLADLGADLAFIESHADECLSGYGKAVPDA